MNVNLLKSQIVKKGLTQEQLALQIKISPNSLSRKLTGKREFRLSEVKNLCEVLEIANPVEIFSS